MAVALVENGRVNPAYLKLDLFCKGMRIDGTASVEADGRGILRTRAGLGSGLEIILPESMYVNVPVTEAWVQGTPYLLYREGDVYKIRRGGDYVCDVTLPRQPAFYDAMTSSGKKMSSIGVLQGTYLGVYPADVCYYWTTAPRINCKFCSVGLNIGDKDARDKTVADVLETVKAARREERITFVHFNTGYYEGDTYLDKLEPFITAVNDETGLLIGVQTPPHPDFKRYDRLKALGVNNVSFCFELFDEETLTKVCPGKSEHVGLKRYLDAIEYCARIFDTANGEIVAGLEPPEKTMEAIEWITGVGAVPTVCVFRPLTGTDYEHEPPPETEALLPVFRRFYTACMERKLPVGIAPNIKVSIVLLPEECRWLLEPEDRGKYRLHRMKLAAMKKAFGLYFNARLKMK